MVDFSHQFQENIRKKWIKICIILICLFITIAVCYNEYQWATWGKNIPETNQVTKIRLSQIPSDGNMKDFDITEYEDIECIINYLKKLHTTRTWKNPNMYYGMSYVLKVYTEENEVIEIVLSGNMFIRIDGKAKELPYSEAVAFEDVLNNIILLNTW